MRRASSILSIGLFLSVSAWSQTNSCDLTLDGKVDAADVQAAINMSLGASTCTASIAGPNVCNVLVVQRVINASLPGGTCTTSVGLHSVILSWAPSSGATGYKVSQASCTSSCPATWTGSFTPLSTVGAVTSYTDNTVKSGWTYYYVVAAVDSSGSTSSNSNQTQAVIPVP